MRKLIIKLAACFLSFAAINVNAFEYNAFENDITFGIGTGYRQDSLNWSIAGPNNVPNVLSELKWKDLRIWQIEGYAKFVSCNHIYLRGKADYGRIFHGKNRDSDYEGNHRTFEFSRADCKAGKGEVFDFSGGAGYQLTYCFDTIKVAPLIGYSYHEQHLRMYEGFQSVDLIEPIFIGPFEGLHSNYRAKWYGPWVGVDLDYEFSCNWTLFGSLEYHLAQFRGTGHWNLRDDFLDDFKQTANWAHGGLISAGVCYDYCNWDFGILASYQSWKTRRGKQHFTIDASDSPGSSEPLPVVVGTRLNGVHWHSFTAVAFASYKW